MAATETATKFTAGPESVAAERFVNEAFAAGRTVVVNGTEAWARFGNPANSWGNGSVSWTSRATTRQGASRTNWAKAGTTVTVTVR